MDIIKEIRSDIGQLNSKNFERLSLELFRYQAFNNPVYHQYLKYLQVDPELVKSKFQIPFLPIEFFKTKTVKTHHTIWEQKKPEAIFESSGTTGMNTSRHFLPDLAFYKQVTALDFQYFYGPLEDYHILALLPSYLERGNASLVVMADHFIKKSGSEFSGFYLDNYNKLVEVLTLLKKQKDRKILLIGVSFALLELAERYNPDLSGVIVMETGGMKGRREELVREELHRQLKESMNLKQVHSEYGMTELISQAYSRQKGQFYTPPWMDILIRDLNDPFLLDNRLRQGGINIIDLANIHSCAFIATQDIGRYSEKSEKYFEVLGRLDNTDIRGCNLLVA